jgi:two-component system LytT family response regulator
MAPNDAGLLRTLVVDDERLARENLRDLLAVHGEIQVIGEAASADEAEMMLKEAHPDLVFLDIQMPGRTGFDLLERLVSPPPIIFVTAFDGHAVRAFEVNALDYLLKPVEPERLARAIKRVGKKEDGPGPVSTLSDRDRVFLDTGRQAIFLPVTDIAAVRAEGNYTHVVSAGGQRYMVRVPLGTWEERLPRDGFILLDRSLMINASHIGSYVLHERGAELYLGNIKEPFLLGRTALRRLREFITTNPATRTIL